MDELQNKKSGKSDHSNVAQHEWMGYQPRIINVQLKLPSCSIRSPPVDGPGTLKDQVFRVVIADLVMVWGGM